MLFKCWTYLRYHYLVIVNILSQRPLLCPEAFLFFVVRGGVLNIVDVRVLDSCCIWTAIHLGVSNLSNNRLVHPKPDSFQIGL